MDFYKTNKKPIRTTMEFSKFLKLLKDHKITKEQYKQVKKMPNEYKNKFNIIKQRKKPTIYRTSKSVCKRNINDVINKSMYNNDWIKDNIKEFKFPDVSISKRNDSFYPYQYNNYFYSTNKSVSSFEGNSMISRKTIINLLKSKFHRSNGLLNLSNEEEKKWNKLIPYYRYCNSCNNKNFNYGQHLYGKAGAAKVNWSKIIEEDQIKYDKIY